MNAMNSNGDLVSFVFRVLLIED